MIEQGTVVIGNRDRALILPPTYYSGNFHFAAKVFPSQHQQQILFADVESRWARGVDCEQLQLCRRERKESRSPQNRENRESVFSFFCFLPTYGTVYMLYRGQRISQQPRWRAV